MDSFKTLTMYTRSISPSLGDMHSRPQSPRSFWPVAGLESSGRTRFSEYAQSIRFVFSTNQIWWEVRESRTSGVGPSQSSRALPQARRIVGSGDENGWYASVNTWECKQFHSKFSLGLIRWNTFKFADEVGTRTHVGKSCVSKSRSKKVMLNYTDLCVPQHYFVNNTFRWYIFQIIIRCIRDWLNVLTLLLVCIFSPFSSDKNYYFSQYLPVLCHLRWCFGILCEQVHKSCIFNIWQVKFQISKSWISGAHY